MSESKRVTREDLLVAIGPLFDGPESVHLDRLGWWDGDLLAVTPRDLATRIFDALPATPPVSETVDAARTQMQNAVIEASVTGSSQGVLSSATRRKFDAACDAFEAAIRAESDERVAALLDGVQPRHDEGSLPDAYVDGFNAAKRALRAALSDADPEDAR